VAKPTEVTIKDWHDPPFTLRVGDTVLQETRYSGFDTGPPVVAAHTVAALCGGAVRQWVRLSNGEEFDLQGHAKGDKSYGYIRAYNAEYLCRAQAERAAFESLRALRYRVEKLNWREVITKPGVAEKLKDLLDAIEAKA
jgi:hypothetical protein